MYIHTQKTHPLTPSHTPHPMLPPNPCLPRPFSKGEGECIQNRSPFMTKGDIFPSPSFTPPKLVGLPSATLNISLDRNFHLSPPYLPYLPTYLPTYLPIPHPPTPPPPKEREKKTRSAMIYSQVFPRGLISRYIRLGFTGGG